MRSQRPSEGGRPSSRELTALASAALAAVVLAVPLLAGVLASLPATVLTESWPSKSVVQASVPESWEFFTRDPKQAGLTMFSQTTRDTFQVAGTLPQTRPENLFGLSRNQRSQDTEKAILADAVTKWTKCSSTSAGACLTAAHSAPAQKVKPATPSNFCGDYVLASQATTHFVYRDLEPTGFSIDAAAHIEIECRQ